LLKDAVLLFIYFPARLLANLVDSVGGFAVLLLKF